MKCRACGRDAVGILNGEPICDRCAQWYGLAEGRAPKPSPQVDIEDALAALYASYTVRPTQFAFISDETHAAILAELRRRDADHRFYKRARLAQESGGCRR